MAPPASDRPKSTRTRALILKHAEDVFGEQGFDAARLADIADRVGIRRASMVYYFRDKASLYQAVLQGLFGELFKRAASTFSSPGELEDRLLRMADLWVDFAWERPAIARILLRELASAGEEVEPRLRAMTHPFFELVEAAKREGAEREGEPPHPVDPLHFVATVAGSTVFFVSGLPALAPELASAEKLRPHREAHRQRVRGLVSHLLTPR